MSTMDETTRRSLAAPTDFWAEAARAIDWQAPWERVLDDRNAPFYRWFVGGWTNTCYNALDRHVEAGDGERIALIYDSALTGTKRRFTYREVCDAVARFAGGLKNLGVEKGDRVIIYMPMVPEALIGMLACARLGAVHSVVFGGFAPRELATRIEHARPKVILSASCGLEPGRVVAYKPMLDEAIAIAGNTVERCVILERPEQSCTFEEGRDLSWEAVAASEPTPCVSVLATDPLYILYTSGTTGEPKGIVRDNGGHMVALRWSMKYVYGVEPGEVFWAASDVGWVVGHSYIVYGPLLHGCATVLYEGKPVGTPDAGAFWRIVAEYGVQTLFTAPTAIRAIKREDPRGERMAEHDRKSLRALFLAGERTDPDTLAWASERLGVPVIDHWWQTESGWPIASNCLGIETLPIKPGSACRAVPGYDVRVLGSDGEPVAAGTMGNIAIKLPLPPGSLPTLWNADERYVRAYLSDYPGYYNTSDAGYIDDEGYIYVMSRTDDIINVAGHRLSTGAMEEVLAAHPDVAECAVIGVADALKGELPLGLVVLKAGVSTEKQALIDDLVKRVRETIGPVAAFKQAVVVARLPKTRSGKVLRGTMRKIADGKEVKVPPTIDDPAILGEIAEALKQLGYPRA